MSITKNSAPDIGDVAFQIYKILQNLEPEDRVRIIRSTVVLLGDENSHAHQTHKGAEQPKGEEAHIGKHAENNAHETPQKYLNHKDPSNRGELLAVVARYLEKSSKKTSCTRAEIKQVILDARRNFDDTNFLRDIKNATYQAGLFNKGGAAGEYTLSYFGQEFTDALPDRQAAKAIKRPGIKKKASTKKTK